LEKLVKAVIPLSIRFHPVSAHAAEERVGYLEICFAGQEVAPMKISGHESRSVFDRHNVMSRSDLSDAAKRLDYPKTGKLALSLKLNRRPQASGAGHPRRKEIVAARRITIGYDVTV
jgi:hypothetical protein